MFGRDEPPGPNGSVVLPIRLGYPASYAALIGHHTSSPASSTGGQGIDEEVTLGEMTDLLECLKSLGTQDQ